MRILDLFSGIGGFSVAGHQLGWQTAAFVERDKFCQAVLASRLNGELITENGKCEDGKIPIYDDITTFDGKAFRGRCDIVTAGFPCQPFSAAGQRRGDTDDRFLWPETVRVVDEARPEWCVFENVAGLLSMVESDPLSDVEIKEVQLFLENDDYAVNSVIERIHRRIVGRIIADLEAIGYSPLRMPDGTPVILCLPACAVGAWHRRDRLWIVAFDSDRERERTGCRSVQGTDGEISERNGNAESGNAEICVARFGGGLAPYDHDRERSGNGIGSEPALAVVELGDREFVAKLAGSGLSESGAIGSTASSRDARLQGSEFAGTSGQGTRASRSVAKCFEYDHWLEAAAELCRVVHGLPAELDAADVQTLEQAVKCLGREEAERTVGFDLGEIENRVWRTERFAEAEKFGIDAVRSRDGKFSGKRIVVTNYERLHYFDPKDFAGMICDESSILKNFDGVTKSAITEFMRKIPYRLLCTATAAPNDYIELGTSSEALGYLGYMDMLGQFFRNDNGTLHSRHSGYDIFAGGKWRFKPHAERPFWRWLCSWARAIRKPSDLGFDDGAFVLPELILNEHVVTNETVPDDMLFNLGALTREEQIAERRQTISARCEKVAELVDHNEAAAVWCHLNTEADLLEKLIPDARQISGADSDDEKEEKFEAFTSGELRVLITKPKIGAFGLNWQHCAHQTAFPSHSFEQWYQGIRRSWRFGQMREVRVDMVSSDGEAGVLANLQRKSDAAEKMFASLVAEMNNELKLQRSQKFSKRMEVPAWM